jgi:hypothetical protein
VNRKANPAAKEALTRTEIRTIDFMSWLVELFPLKVHHGPSGCLGATNQHCNYGLPPPLTVWFLGFFN